MNSTLMLENQKSVHRLESISKLIYKDAEVIANAKDQHEISKARNRTHGNMEMAILITERMELIEEAILHEAVSVPNLTELRKKFRTGQSKYSRKGNEKTEDVFGRLFPYEHARYKTLLKTVIVDDSSPQPKLKVSHEPKTQSFKRTFHLMGDELESPIKLQPFNRVWNQTPQPKNDLEDLMVLDTVDIEALDAFGSMDDAALDRLFDDVFSSAKEMPDFFIDPNFFQV